MSKMPEFLNPILNDLVSANPAIKTNPMTAGLISILESGDEKKGQQMAANLCESMGVSQEEALKQAKRFFNIP